MFTRQYPVLDVRSPGEYKHAHMPGAYSFPLFSDEERKEVGILYKQQGREDAIKAGLDFFGGKMRKIVEEAEKLIAAHQAQQKENQGSKTVLVHCWRGGMRSAAIAWLLDLYGFKVYTLAGGYKSFRNWVLTQLAKPFSFRIIGGYTGSGKTQVLKELAKTGHIIDLEGIAHHKGSAFGGLGEPAQPSPEMFENTLALALHNIPDGNSIWLEDESRRIGNINMPESLWKTMRQSPVYFLQVPFEERLNYITREYGKFNQGDLAASIMRIQKRLGGLNTKNAINFLLEKNYKECFRILLAYYDKFYEHGLYDREGAKDLVTIIPCDKVNTKENSRKLLAIKQTA